MASHFNRQTPLDSGLYVVMGGLILFVTAVIIDLTVRWFRTRPPVPADMLLAARAGLVLLAYALTRTLAGRPRFGPLGGASIAASSPQDRP